MSNSVMSQPEGALHGIKIQARDALNYLHRPLPLLLDDGNDVTMSAICGSLQRGWRLIFLATILFGFGSILYTMHEPLVYSASMRITAPLDQQSQTPAAGGVLNALIGSQQSSSRNFTQFLNLLHSNRVAQLFMRDPNWIAHIYGKSWHYVDGGWISANQSGLVERIKAAFFSLFGIKIQRGPSIPSLYLYLVGNVTQLSSSESSSLLGSGQSQIVTISATGDSPENARNLLMATITAADTIMKESEKRNFAQRIAYLSSRLNNVMVSDYRAALIASLSDQERSAMFINDKGYYSLFVLDDPVLDTVPVAPKPARNFMIAILLGFVASLLFVLFRDGLAKRQEAGTA